jgi:RNA polymerase sigma-70 factor (ECF subfamily)
MMTTVPFWLLRRRSAHGLTPSMSIFVPVFVPAAALLTVAGGASDSRRPMRIERSDEAWVEALRSSGPTASHVDVVSDLRDFLRRTLAKGFGPKLTPEDLEDLAQESLLRVHHKLDTFQGQSRFTTWAATIAVNCTLSELRRRRYEHLSIEEAGDTVDWSASEGDVPADEEQIALLRRGIAEALTDKQREAIQAALGGLPLMELARRWNVSQGAIYKLLHDARRRLKSYMEDTGNVGRAGAAQGWAS